MTLSTLASPEPPTLQKNTSIQSVPATNYEALAGLIDSLDALSKTQSQSLNPLDKVEVELLESLTKRILHRNGFPVPDAPHLFIGGMLNTPGYLLTKREALYKCLLSYENYSGKHAYLIARGWSVLQTTDATEIELGRAVIEIITFCHEDQCPAN